MINGIDECGYNVLQPGAGSKDNELNKVHRML